MARVKTRTSMSAKKKAAAVAAAVLCLALLLGGAFAWRDFSQRATNIFHGAADNDVLLHDDFTPHENKDVYVENTGDTELYVRVQFAEFLQIGNDVLVGGSLKDKKSYQVHKYDACTFASHEYYDWLQSGRGKIFLPGVSEIADITYTEEGILGGNGQYTKSTFPTSDIILMSAWSVMSDADKEALPACWILDDSADGNGWAYWSKPLPEGEATNLLLDNVTLKEGMNPEDNYVYAIDVRMQATNKTEVKEFLKTDDISDDAKDIFEVPEVTDVTINGGAATAYIGNTAGSTLQLNTVVSGTNNPPQTVIYEISNDNFLGTLMAIVGKNTATGIKVDNNGVLKMTEDIKAGTTYTVKAYSAYDTGVHDDITIEVTEAGVSQSGDPIIKIPGIDDVWQNTETGEYIYIDPDTGEETTLTTTTDSEGRVYIETGIPDVWRDTETGDIVKIDGSGNTTAITITDFKVDGQINADYSYTTFTDGGTFDWSSHPYQEVKVYLRSTVTGTNVINLTNWKIVGQDGTGATVVSTAATTAGFTIPVNYEGDIVIRASVPDNGGATRSLTFTVRVQKAVPAGMEVASAQRTLTSTAAGDTADWLEIATYGDYSLIVRKRRLLLTDAPSYLSTSHTTTYGTGNNYANSANNVRGAINEWYSALDGESLLRKKAVAHDARSQLGKSFVWTENNGFSKPLGEPRVGTEDVAFALSSGEAVTFLAKYRYFYAGNLTIIYNTLNGTSSGTPLAAYSNWSALADGSSVGSWLRSPGHNTTHASYLLTGGGVSDLGLADLLSVRPALWVKSDIFE